MESTAVLQTEQLQLIRLQVRDLSTGAHAVLRDELLPAFEREGIQFLDLASLSAEQHSMLCDYFLQSVFPVLTPLAFDPGRPFPHISNRSLNLAVVVANRQGAEHFARVKVPDTLAQLVPVSLFLGQNSSGPAPVQNLSSGWSS